MVFTPSKMPKASLRASSALWLGVWGVPRDHSFRDSSIDSFYGSTKRGVEIF